MLILYSTLGKVSFIYRNCYGFDINAKKILLIYNCLNQDNKNPLPVGPTKLMKKDRI